MNNKFKYENVEMGLGARGSVAGGTMLRSGRSPARFPMRSPNFPIDIILPAAVRPRDWLIL
jgi:hypothetical protein